MIIYGSRATQLSSGRIKGQCPNCESEDSLRMEIYQRYAHIFWIPFFPFQKLAYTECKNCRHVMEKENFTPAIREKYDTENAKTKTPIWMFSFLMIIACFCIYMFVEAYRTKAQNKAFIEAPQIGDIYDLHTESTYTIIKVNNIVGDSIYFSPNEYETSKESGLGQIRAKGSSAFTDDTYSTTKEKVKELYEDGTIINVHR